MESAEPRRRRGALLRLLVGLAAAALLVALTDPGAVLARLGAMDPSWLAAAFAVQAVGKLVWAWRWSLVLRLVGLSVRFGRLVQGLLVGLFFGNVLPTSFGGDLVRAHWILEERAAYGRSLFAVFVERFVGFACLGWIALPAALLVLGRGAGPDVLWLLPLLAALATAPLLLAPRVFGAATGLLLRGRRLAEARERGERAVRALHEQRGLRWSIYGLSLGVHLVGVAFYLCVGRALGLALEPWHYLVLVPLTTVATGFPFTFNGLGVREGALVLVLRALEPGLDPAEAVTLGLAAFAVNLAVSVAGGIAWFMPSGAGARARPVEPGRADALAAPEPR